jgi:triacylglycerol esterase/lipase EstA (alpha/beta hydrolase family)
VTVPNHTDGDIQIAGEYVVHAIREIRKRSHRRVILFGWSQGGSTLPRWALRWWPGARRKVISQVGIAPLHNRGSVVADSACVSGSCIPAAWQQGVGSQFMGALNSRRQVFDGIAYTALYTRYDDVVTPDYDGALSQLPEQPNTVTVALQDVCATDTSDHITIPASNTAWALALDAFRHPGQPASVSRIDTAAVCADPTMPGVNDSEYPQRIAQIMSLVGPHLQQGQVDEEPALRCYVTASCAKRKAR